jgi:hypothetical protein
MWLSDGTLLHTDGELGATGNSLSDWTDDQTIHFVTKDGTFSGVVACNRSKLTNTDSNLEFHLTKKENTVQLSCLRVTKDREGLSVVQELSVFD